MRAKPNQLPGDDSIDRNGLFTNPATGFSYSTVYRNGSTYTLPAFPVNQPGTCTMTAYYTNVCGQSSTDTRTFVVTGTGCN